MHRKTEEGALVAVSSCTPSDFAYLAAKLLGNKTKDIKSVSLDKLIEDCYV